MSQLAQMFPTELSKRVATGLTGAVALLLVIIFGGLPGIFVLTLGLSIGLVHEFGKMTFSLSDATEKRYVLLCISWFLNLTSVIGPKPDYELMLVVFFGLSAYFLFSAGRHSEPAAQTDGPPVAGREFGTHFKELMFSIFGILYLVFMPIYLVRIHEMGNGVHWTIMFLMMVWAGDTGAYFVGKKYGRYKLYPLISPNKTIEGAVGGLVAGVIVTLLYRVAFFRELSWGTALIIPLIVGPFAQIGDLCESFLKRAFDKKDSGSILPGHGGFLDRFDGVVFGLPIMYACIRLLT